MEFREAEGASGASGGNSDYSAAWATHKYGGHGGATDESMEKQTPASAGKNAIKPAVLASMTMASRHQSTAQMSWRGRDIKARASTIGCLKACDVDKLHLPLGSGWRAVNLSRRREKQAKQQAKTMLHRVASHHRSR